MIPKPGDVIESNQIGCNQYTVVDAINRGDGLHLHLQVIWPKAEATIHPRTVDCWFNSLREDGHLLVTGWITADMPWWSTIHGADDTPFRRLEFRLIERSRGEQQLDLFGEAA